MLSYCIVLTLSLWLLTTFQSATCYIISHRYSSFRHRNNLNHQQPIQNQKILNKTIHQSSITSLSSSSSSSHQDNENSTTRIRLNKVFKASHSRRESDKLIASGRVSVNGQRIESKGGFFVIPHVDVVSLDGVVVRGWEDMNAVDSKDSTAHGSALASSSASASASASELSTNANAVESNRQVKSHFEYIKYYKPVGVTCTTDSKVKNNIIDSIQRNGYISPHRIYPVGRLDKDTSGLIILTSDGRLPNAVLKGINKQPKVYKVQVDYTIDDRDIQRLRDGIMITTVAQRDRVSKKLTQRTKPCKVERLGSRAVQITLMEGRNRQIRKMMGALGYTVIKLHRAEFMNINLESGFVRTSREGTTSTSSNRPQKEGLSRPGDWSFLDEQEMKLVDNAMHSFMTNNELKN